MCANTCNYQVKTSNFGGKEYFYSNDKIPRNIYFASDNNHD